jgi:hypothetical protein
MFLSWILTSTIQPPKIRLVSVVGAKSGIQEVQRAKAGHSSPLAQPKKLKRRIRKLRILVPGPLEVVRRRKNRPSPTLISETSHHHLIGMKAKRTMMMTGPTSPPPRKVGRRKRRNLPRTWTLNWSRLPRPVPPMIGGVLG